MNMTHKLRCLLIIVSLMFTVVICSAQHMSFLGIPINGSLSSFQNKLANKGFKYNQTESRLAPSGERVFSGTWKGHKALVSVFYNRKTNNVYEVELSIESDDINVIQSMLDKTRKEIEKDYAYFAEHDVEDGRNLHYRYHILPQSTNADPIGTIHVKPTYAYLFDNGGHNVGTVYVLQLNYEDKQNVSLLTPSVTKPRAEKWVYEQDPEKFFKYLVWANEFKKAGDLDKQIDYLESALNYFKYNCVPSGATITEEQIDNEILTAQKKCVGKVPNWASNKTANVYKCFDNTRDKWFYTFASNLGLIRVYIDELEEYTQNMRKVKEIFMTKIYDNANKELREFWHEEEKSPLVVNYGEDTMRGKYGFGDYVWGKKNIVLRFEKSNTGIYIQLSPTDKSYMPMMTFGNIQELEQHINFFQSLMD